MNRMLFTIGSVTQAARLAKKAQGMGAYDAEMVHTPSRLNKGGCSYSVMFPEERLDIMMLAAKKYRINIRKIYRRSADSDWEEYDDLSG